MVDFTVAYEGGINPLLDRLLRDSVKAAGGVELGSGAMLVKPYRRDISFRFTDNKTAQRLMASLRGYEWAHGVHVLDLEAT